MLWDGFLPISVEELHETSDVVQRRVVVPPSIELYVDAVDQHEGAFENRFSMTTKRLVW